MYRGSQVGALTVALLLFGTFAVADHLSTPPSGLPAELIPLPELDISGAEPWAQQAINAARGLVDRMLVDHGAQATEPEIDLAEAYGRLGAYYHVYNILTGAEVCYRNAIALAPEVFRWRHLYAYLVHKSGRSDEALALFGDARGIDTDYPALDLYEGEALLGLNRASEALPFLEKALRREELRAYASFLLGQIALDQRDYATAVPLLQTAVKTDPSGDSVYFALGQALRGMGRIEEARAALSKRGKEKPHVGDRIVDEMFALNQGARPFYLKGMAAASASDYATVAKVFGKGLEIDPDNFRARVTYARALYLSGKRKEARRELIRVAEQAPLEEPLAVFLLGVLDNAAGDLDSARQKFDQILKAHPHHSGASYFLGLLDFQAGQYASAVLRLDAAVADEPGNYLAQVLALVARLRSGEDIGMITARSAELVDKAPMEFVPGYAHVRLLAANHDPSLRDARSAMELAEKLVSGQQIPPAYEAFALAQAAAGEWEAAEASQNEARSGYFFAGRYADLPRLDAGLENIKNKALPADAWPEDDAVLNAPRIDPYGPFLEYPAARAY